MDAIKSQLSKEFLDKFQYNNDDDITYIFAPGRVNVIGEHTDYNGGNVFPAALNIGTYIAISPREDTKVRCYSINFPEDGVLEFALEQLYDLPTWNKYVVGVIVAFKELHNVEFGLGFDMVLYGTIPSGAGLSSSASLGVGIATALNSIYDGLGLDPIKLALIAQKAEHISGVNCGIMDQFASAMGKKNHAILLDCNTLEYTYTPLSLGEYSLVIMDSQKKHQLQDSKYNERRAECEKALTYLQQKLDVKTLGEISEEEFFDNIDLIPDEILQKRARHAVTENQRTLKAMDCLKQNDIPKLGELLNASHYSLRDDYEVTGYELDSLTEVAREFEGVLGSRMTGAGFGGSCIAIVPTASVEEFIKHTEENYFKKTNLQAKFYTTTIEDGARII